MKRIILIIFFLFNCTFIFAQGQAGIYGVVLDENSNEIINTVKINVTSKDKSYEYKTESDLQGYFEIKNIYGGSYQILLSRIGYISKLLDINIDDFEKKSLTLSISKVENKFEKINITATRAERTIQKTPSSINLISSDDILSKNIFTFDEALQDVQGITISRNGEINTILLSIRGSSDVGIEGTGNRVLLLLDGKPILTGDSKSTLLSQIPVSMIERTEVVKGAFSSLYGSSAIGGVVNVITKRASFKPYTRINLNYGFYNKLSDSLKFSDKLQTFQGINILHSNTIKKFSYLLNFDYKKSDGYSEMTNFNNYNGFAKMSYDLFRNRKIEINIQYTCSEGGYPHYWRVDPGKYPEPYKISPIYIGDKINNETQRIDFTYYTLPDTKSKFSSKFYYFKINSNSTFNPENPISATYGNFGQEFKTNITSYNFGSISQLDYELSHSHYLISGIDAQWNVIRSYPSELIFSNQQQNNLGIFAQERWNILKQKNGESILSSTIGGRADYNWFVGGSNNFQLNPKFSLLFSPVSNNNVFDNTSFRFLIGRAFRAPSITEQYLKKELNRGMDFNINPNLKPENVYSLEFGIRKQYKAKFIFDISVFFNLYDNLIQNENIGNTISGPYKFMNIVKAQSKGIDFMIEYGSSFRLFKEKIDYKFEFDYTYNDMRDLSANRKDDYLPYRPKHLINTFVNFNYFGFNININGKYLSKIDKVIYYANEVPNEYYLFNAKLSKEITKKISIFFAVNNIFDKFYQELERTVSPNRSFNSGISVEL